VAQLSRARLGLALALLAGGCTSATLPESPTPAWCPVPPPLAVNREGLIQLPNELRQVTPDPESAWAYGVRDTLGRPALLAGRGAETAQGLARLEFLANSFTHNMRFLTSPGLAQPRMQQGRRALREWLGIPPTTPDAQVVGALFATECALRANDRAAAARALAQVAQAPDALEAIAPSSGAPPAIPAATQVAASSAVWAVQGNERGQLRFGP
jgi:hypothetical protein